MQSTQEVKEDASARLAGQPDRCLMQLSNLHKYYDTGSVRVHALRGIALDVYPGDFVAIMGASGSGKSTLMNIIGCLDKPSEGKYLLEGTDVGRLSRHELAQIRNQRIGFVFQAFNLLGKLTVLENVELPMIYSGASKKLRRQRAMEAIERVGLENRMKNTPLQLSGGQMQRVAIARALVNDPRIVFADEPTGNLDSTTGANILALFRELSEQGRTIVLVTHDNDIAENAPRRIVIRDGKIRNSSDYVGSGIRPAPALAAQP